MNVLKSTPPVLAADSCERPPPSTNRNSSGWISDVTIRIRSALKRISSRRQTILMARTSLRHVRGGTRTRTTSVTTLISTPPGSFAPWANTPSETSPQGEASPSSAAPGHHLHDPAVARGRGVLLSVADRGARVAHEHVVERRPCDADRPDADPELGEQARDELLARGHEERDRALGQLRLEPEALFDRGDRALVVLGLDPHAIGADLGLERLRRVERDDLAVVHDRDPIAELGLVHVVRGHEDRDLLALLQLADVAPDRRSGLGVEPDRRLVEEEHAR